MVPTRRALVLLVLGLPLAAVPLAAPWLGALVVATWLALALGFVIDAIDLLRASVGLRFEFPSTAAVGGDVEVEIALTRRAGPALRVELRSEVGLPLDEAPQVDAVVRHGGASTFLAVGTPRRGRGSIDAVWARTHGPLGLLAKVDRFADDAGPIDVIPDIARVARTVLEHLGAEPMLGGLKRDPWAGHGTEFESLQGYVQGMDLRSVDWKTSARHQAVRVRRFHLERRQRVVLSIDAGRAMRDPIDGLDRIDHAVHTGLALARAALLTGDLVGLHAYADRPLAFVPPKAGPPQFQRLRRNAAQLAVQTAETNHVLGLRDLLVRLDRRSFVVVFTEFGDVTTAELMVEVLGHLARRHLVVFVALDDPTTEAPLAAEPATPLAVASAVVAASLGERRLEVLARLHARGVHVIHSRPGLVAGRLLARYLDVKRKGLLG